jgi:hypothetical protein
MPMNPKIANLALAGLCGLYPGALAEFLKGGKAQQPVKPWRELPDSQAPPPPKMTGSKQPRNARCYCGSGKKAKHCHTYLPAPPTPPAEKAVPDGQ